MIPKRIFTCWLSDPATMPEVIQKLVAGQLKYHQEYQHFLIDNEKFQEIKETLPRWVLKAYENKDYAHVSDYLRVYFLYTYGGIYLDSDVQCIRHYNIFDKYLNYSFFGGVECSTDYYFARHLIGNQYSKDSQVKISLKDEAFNKLYKFDIRRSIQDEQKEKEFLYDNNNANSNLIENFCYGVAIDGAMFGTEKGCAVLKDVLDIYNSPLFIHYVEDYNTVKKLHYYPNICNILAKAFEKYGFTYDYKFGQDYLFNNNKYKLSTSNFLSVTDYYNRDNSKCELVHHCTGSWKRN